MRLIRSGDLPPALNLALDEALLRSGTETLRLYGWSPAGLSIGYFQEASHFEVPDGFRLVRRPTGGGAIAHEGELTIAWIARRRRVGDVYRMMNDVVSAALVDLGAPTPTTGEERPAAAPRGLCFDSYTCYDLLLPGGKVFGSAQRRAGDRFLLHGTLVLEPNPLSRGAVSLAEVLGRTVPRAQAEHAIVAALAGSWNRPIRARGPGPEEWRLADRLVVERYAHPAWTLRR